MASLHDAEWIEFNKLVDSCCKQRTILLEKTLYFIHAQMPAVILYSLRRLSGGDEQVYPPGWNQPVQSIHLKTKIRHKTRNVDANHFQCRCLVSGRSCGHSSYIFDVYIYRFSADPSFKKLA